MNIHELISQLLVDTKGTAGGSFWSITKDSSLWAFLPELILCATIVLMLLVRVFNWGRRVDAFYFALIGSGLALWFAAPWSHLGTDGTIARMEIFTGMLVYDSFSIYIRSLLLLFAALFAVFTKLSGLPDRQDGPDIYALVLGATLGMCLMASANHLLMVFMAVEMASVPSYVLAAMLKGRKQSSEAALKYAVYGAGTAGVMLYGISLIAGLLNTVHLPTMAVQLADKLPDMPAGELMVLAVAGLMIAVGLAFKLSAVPFHFWCPDVFEGATAEVNAFLSIASKAAALALLIRVAIGFGALPPVGQEPGQETAAAVVATETLVAQNAAPSAALMSVSDEEVTAPSTMKQTSREVKIAALAPVRGFIGRLVALLAIVTCTFGNLAAYGQTNIKRLLAYSTIAHAGYMMMAVPAVMEMAGIDAVAAQNAVAALCIYIAIYVFMNLGAFAVIAFLRNAMQSEEIADYAGLIRRCPWTVILFATILFSLVGLPPLAGFIGKFAIFASLVEGYEVSGTVGQPAFYLLIVLLAGGINSAISLFYYLRVVKTMTMDPEPETRRPFTFSMISLQGAYIWLATAPVVALFFVWNWLNELTRMAAQNLFS